MVAVCARTCQPALSCARAGAGGTDIACGSVCCKAGTHVCSDVGLCVAAPSPPPPYGGKRSLLMAPRED